MGLGLNDRKAQIIVTGNSPGQISSLGSLRPLPSRILYLSATVEASLFGRETLYNGGFPSSLFSFFHLPQVFSFPFLHPFLREHFETLIFFFRIRIPEVFFFNWFVVF